VPSFSDPTAWSIDNISDEHGRLISAVTVREKKIEFLETESKVLEVKKIELSSVQT
jgi:hypothetical protein